MSDRRTASGIGMTSARTRERLVRRIEEQGVTNPDVLERIRQVPRHLFVDEALESRSYEDSALPIGQGQTISQPFIVALMTQSLLEFDGKLRRLDKVLEVGTGCGYQTAVLAPLVRFLFTVERIGKLSRDARARVGGMNIGSIRFRCDDGFRGWPGQAPFDGIIVTAAPPEVPEVLLEQLVVGGRLVIPVGPDGNQELLRITRTEEGFEREVMGRVSFVPMLEGREVK